ncbi:serine/threonine protein kinase [Fusarium austroafricanum]|uniref:Serine/threonine protein kinase n=1 Tax=Fusarium austroafricanum TaxID=2364996 RepID=A0A8H4KD52_9HYPO|nr:serine/threonine protein kinase [Fusarium austroafricanum]
MSLSEIASSSGISDSRRAEAAYSLGITRLLRIGTIRPADRSSEYTGYTINSSEVRHWLPLDSANNPGYKFDPETVPDISIVKSWLKTATCLGSHIASKWLRELDVSLWQDARHIFKTEYCGIGHNLFENVSLDSLDAASSSHEINSAGDRFLHLAATQGHIDIVKRLCARGSSGSVNVSNNRGETALFQACRSGHYHVSKYLISVGADAGICSTNGKNTLHWLYAFDVAEAELSELASLMVEAGAGLKKVCTENTLFNHYFREAAGPGTPLCRMVQQDAFVAAKVLIKLGANPYNVESNFAMIAAVSSHNSAFIELFLNSDHELALKTPKACGEGLRLPIYLATELGSRPIFDKLLLHAGPNTEIGVPDFEGIADDLFPQFDLTHLQSDVLQGCSTIATFPVSSSFKNLVHQASAASPGPHFLESVLKELSAAQAKELVNSHGYFDDVAEVLLKYGANIEEEGHCADRTKGVPMTTLGALITFNNHSSAAAVAWILNHNPSFIINTAAGLTAFAMAIRSGEMFEIAPLPRLIPIRLYDKDNTVLSLLVNRFGKGDSSILGYLPEHCPGMTALQLAVCRLNPGAVQMLLTARANRKLGIKGPGIEPVSAIDCARDLKSHNIPPEARARGTEEVERYLGRFGKVRQVFVDYGDDMDSDSDSIESLD